MAARARPARHRAGYTPEACTTQELQAAALRRRRSIPGASALLDQFRMLQATSNAAQQELTRIPGIGPARVASVKVALELARWGSESACGTPVSRREPICPCYARKKVMTLA